MSTLYRQPVAAEPEFITEKPIDIDKLLHKAPSGGCPERRFFPAAA